jgi:hypothetical protein
MADTLTERHECSFVELGDRFYLLGGRGLKEVEAYNPSDSSWDKLGFTPQEFHHFQATEYHGLLYVICAFEGTFPIETGIPFIYIYDPITDSWMQGADIPAARVRGSAGVVLYEDKFYISNGILDGHRSGWVGWLDEYNPATGAWRILADAPNPRDHFAAVVLDDELVCAGGRRSGDGGGTWDSVVYKTDVFDFNTETWRTLASPAGDIPTGRAGCSAASFGGEVIIIGGESADQWPAHDEVEALDMSTESWRSMSHMIDGRHGSQAICNNGGIYIASGSGSRGCCPELSTMEAFYPDSMETDPILFALSAAGFDLSSTDLGSTSLSTPLNVDLDLNHLSGNQALLIRELNLSGDLEIELNHALQLPVAVAPGQSLSLPFSFESTVAGDFSTQLEIVYGVDADTIYYSIEASANLSCDSTYVPTGLAAVSDPAGTTLSWDAVDGAVKCEVQGRQLGAPSFAKLRVDVPPHEAFIDASRTTPGTSYEWKLRCACSLSPLEVSQFSVLDTFTTSLLRDDQPAIDAQILPNPATDLVEVYLNQEAQQIRLLDIQGRQVQQIGGSQLGYVRIQVVDYPRGWYLLEVQTEQERKVFKILLQ